MVRGAGCGVQGAGCGVRGTECGVRGAKHLKSVLALYHISYVRVVWCQPWGCRDDPVGRLPRIVPVAALPILAINRPCTIANPQFLL